MSWTKPPKPLIISAIAIAAAAISGVRVAKALVSWAEMISWAVFSSSLAAAALAMRSASITMPRECASVRRSLMPSPVLDSRGPSCWISKAFSIACWVAAPKFLIRSARMGRASLAF